jgi:hypothetical protein
VGSPFWPPSQIYLALSLSKVEAGVGLRARQFSGRHIFLLLSERKVEMHIFVIWLLERDSRLAKLAYTSEGAVTGLGFEPGRFFFFFTSTALSL